MRCSLSHIREAEADRLCPRMIGASTVALGVICRALLRTRTRQNKFSLIKKKPVLMCRFDTLSHSVTVRMGHVVCCWRAGGLCSSCTAGEACVVSVSCCGYMTNHQTEKKNPAHASLKLCMSRKMLFFCLLMTPRCD